MNRLTRALHSFTGTAIGMCCCQRILSIIPILSKVFEEDAATVIEFIRLDLHNFGGFEDFFPRPITEYERAITADRERASLPRFCF